VGANGASKSGYLRSAHLPLESGMILPRVSVIDCINVGDLDRQSPSRPERFRSRRGHHRTHHLTGWRRPACQGDALT
jgi:hypothetical protein